MNNRNGWMVKEDLSTHGIMGRRLRYRKWVPPQQLGDVADMQLQCYQTREWGQPTNGSAAWQHGSQSHGFAVRVWSNLCICCPGVVKLVRSNLGTSFPLFHDPNIAGQMNTAVATITRDRYWNQFWKCKCLRQKPGHPRVLVLPVDGNSVKIEADSAF